MVFSKTIMFAKIGVDYKTQKSKLWVQGAKDFELSEAQGVSKTTKNKGFFDHFLTLSSRFLGLFGTLF